jgi:hypothetical protein
MARSVAGRLHPGSRAPIGAHAAGWRIAIGCPVPAGLLDVLPHASVKAWLHVSRRDKLADAWGQTSNTGKWPPT